MVVSLKANRKRIVAFLLLAVIVVGACLLLQGREEEEAPPVSGGTNEERVAFLESFGWQVQTEPVETREVIIPAEFNDVYTAYNVMQQAQGFDLKPYAGEICTQYLYKIENHPNDPEVYATLLVYGDQIIGGDVASTQVDGFMHGFAPDSAHFGMPQESGTESSQAEATATPSPAAESSELSSDSSQVAQKEPAQTEGTQTPSVETEAAGEVLPEEAYPVD